MRSDTPGVRLGIVTYRIAEGWDLETLIRNSEELGLASVELRTTHSHGVEPTLSKAERAEVRRRFASSPVELWCLGSICQYHDADPAEVRKNVEETKRWIALARDVGAVGVKVRPNGVPPAEAGVPLARTLEQVGAALGECAAAADDEGVKLWCEVHGRTTAEPANMRRILEIGGHPNLGAAWNCNHTDLIDGDVRPGFDLLKDWISYVHLHDLTEDYRYPYRDLFELLAAEGFAGPMLAEIGASSDPLRLMRYF